MNDIGEVSAECILDYFASEKNQKILERLREYGLTMELAEDDTIGDLLAGLTIVVTGTLPNLGRKEAQELLKRTVEKLPEVFRKRPVMCWQEKMREAN